MTFCAWAVLAEKGCEELEENKKMQAAESRKQERLPGVGEYWEVRGTMVDRQ